MLSYADMCVCVCSHWACHSPSDTFVFVFSSFFIYLQLCMKSNEKCNQNGIIHICFISDSLNMFKNRINETRRIFSLLCWNLCVISFPTLYFFYQSHCFSCLRPFILSISRKLTECRMHLMYLFLSLSTINIAIMTFSLKKICLCNKRLRRADIYLF